MLDLDYAAPAPKVIAGAKHDWELVIGLEVHAQVATKAKLFSGATCCKRRHDKDQMHTADRGTTWRRRLRRDAAGGQQRWARGSFMHVYDH